MITAVSTAERFLFFVLPVPSFNCLPMSGTLLDFFPVDAVDDCRFLLPLCCLLIWSAFGVSTCGDLFCLAFPLFFSFFSFSFFFFFFFLFFFSSLCLPSVCLLLHNCFRFGFPSRVVFYSAFCAGLWVARYPGFIDQFKPIVRACGSASVSNLLFHTVVFAWICWMRSVL